jgi:hypothetical protein
VLALAGQNPFFSEMSSRERSNEGEIGEGLVPGLDEVVRVREETDVQVPALGEMDLSEVGDAAEVEEGSKDGPEVILARLLEQTRPQDTRSAPPNFTSNTRFTLREASEDWLDPPHTFPRGSAHSQTSGEQCHELGPESSEGATPGSHKARYPRFLQQIKAKMDRGLGQTKAFVKRVVRRIPSLGEMLHRQVGPKDEGTH